MSESIVELIKSVIRPIGLLFWLVMRVLCEIKGVDLDFALSIGFDAATLEYFVERGYKRWKGK